MNIAVLVSGGGTTLQALIDAQSRGDLSPGKLTLVISSRRDAYALERAKAAGIDALVVRPRDFEGHTALDEAMLSALITHNIEVIALGGYLSLLGPTVVKRYNRKILNVHPSLLPSFGGKGFYGLKVHEAALEYGVKVTGATVHFVNEIYDDGEIILQKAVEILPGDTPEILQQRVMHKAEWVIFPKAIGMVCRKEI